MDIGMRILSCDAIAISLCSYIHIKNMQKKRVWLINEYACESL